MNGPSPKQVTPREDMVIRPRIRGQMTKPQRQAMNKRAADHVKSKRGAVGKILRRGIQRAAVRGVATVARAAGAQSSSAGMVGGALVGAALLTVLVAGRLISGRSFENMGDNLREMMLGDTSPEAMAKRTTRQQMEANDNVMALASLGDGITPQMRKAFDGLYRVNLLEERGKQMMRSDKSFQVNGMLDMLILAAKQKLVAKWRALGGDQAAIDARNAFHIQQLGGIYK